MLSWGTLRRRALRVFGANVRGWGGLGLAWAAVITAAVGVRLWNALYGPILWGYDAWGHVAYVLFLDVYRGLPWADQGWSYFHPPLHYAIGWVLAQVGSSEFLIRGLALLGSAASLATAALAALVAARAWPARRDAVFIAFASIACLPVHLYVSPMPGNKLTEVVLSSAAVAVFVAAGGPRRGSVRADLAVGGLLGLSLLTAFSGLLALLAIGAALLAESWRRHRKAGTGPAGDRRNPAARAGLVVGVALALCAPWYARNVAEFGAPFQKSSDFALVARAESRQPPGERGWSDFTTFPPRLFVAPAVRTEPLLRSVWGTAYAGTWADLYRETAIARSPAAHRNDLDWSARMTWVGVLPTLLVLAGAGALGRDVLRGRGGAAGTTVLLLAAGNVAAFGLHAVWTPTWAAAKASYLLGGSLAFGIFAARGALLLRALWPRGGGPAALAVVAASGLAAAAVAVEGFVLTPRGESPAVGAAHYQFGEYDGARRVFARLASRAPFPVPWLDNLAAVEVATRHPDRAVRLYAHAERLAEAAGRRDPQRIARHGVALTLAGRRADARERFDTALERSADTDWVRANRGVLRAVMGDLAGAESDLRAALDSDPSLTPAWLALGSVLAAAGDPDAARAAHDRASQAACRTPRGYPYGLGPGEVLEWGIGRRWLLLLDDVDGAGLRVALPDFYRLACARLARGGAS